MSNFSTFFPSGGGGEGSGINSYAPFKVGTTDNNPPGYIHSTGVYTNPVDESVWLKTGKSVADNTQPFIYPNSFRTFLGYGTLAQLFNTTPQTDGSIGGITILNGKYWVADKSFSATIYEYTFAGVYTGNSIFTGNQHGRVMVGLTTDGTDLWMVTDFAGAFKYTTAGVYTGDTVAGISNSFSITYSSGTNSLWIGRTFQNQTILEYTLAGLPTGIGIVPPVAGNPPKCIYSSSANTIQWIDSTNSKLYETDLTTLESTLPYGDDTPGGGLTIQGLIYNTTEDYLVYTGAEDVFSWGDLGSIVGDVTARTDSSGSGQPLFIKLK